MFFVSQVHLSLAGSCYYYTWFQKALEFVHGCPVESPDRVVHLLVVALRHHRLLRREFLSVQPFLPPGPFLVRHSQHPLSFAYHTTHYGHGSLRLRGTGIRDLRYSERYQSQQIVTNYSNIITSAIIKLLLIVNSWTSFLLILLFLSPFATWKNRAETAEWNVGPMTLWITKEFMQISEIRSPAGRLFIMNNASAGGKSDTLTSKSLVNENWYASHLIFAHRIVDLSYN